jgi:AcrR family transcriptional regulator
MTNEEPDERNGRRDERIMRAACKIVEDRGLSALSRDAIAAEAGVAPSSVSNFGRSRITNGDHPRGESYRTRILRDMMGQAVDRGDLRIIRIGLADGCLRSDDVPVHLRAAAVLS